MNHRNMMLRGTTKKGDTEHSGICTKLKNNPLPTYPHAVEGYLHRYNFKGKPENDKENLGQAYLIKKREGPWEGRFIDIIL